jgi:beta-lactamase superfamily II metal-dependent hydrolase
MIKKTIYFALVFLFTFGCTINKKEEENQEIKVQGSQEMNSLSPWREGFLDIHHINTGNGDVTYFKLPDGTTMLFDAGIMDKEGFEKKYYPLKATGTIPNDSITAAQWIANYIQELSPSENKNKIDYALVSHFHSDHYGSLMKLGDILDIDKVIDRDFPYYKFPLNIKKHLKNDNLFNEYLSFIGRTEVKTEKLEAGRSDQIVLVKNKENYPTFKVVNVKSNATIWSGQNSDTIQYFSADDMVSYYNGSYNENPLSLAIKLSYGKFDYFTGGDNTGLQGFGLPNWFDVETPMAKAVGKVEVTTLNHHSNRDATNEFFVNTLNPKVVVQQSWCSDHPGQEVYQRLIYLDKDSILEKRDIFSTNMHPETLVTYGPWFRDNYKSIQGHIVIRVLPGGGQYFVYILDEKELAIKQKHGPYLAK